MRSVIVKWAGPIGMLFCLVPLFLGMLEVAAPQYSSWVGRLAEGLGTTALPSVAAGTLSASKGMNQVLLTIGAAFLFLCALARGRSARLFQILEGALIAYGIISCLEFPYILGFLMRGSVSVGMWVLLWRSGLLANRIDRIGALGLELLGLGYLFAGSTQNWSFFVGGVLLTVYCGHWAVREPNFINYLWTALNGPFAAGALAVEVVRLTTHWDQGDAVNFCIAAIFLGVALPMALIQDALEERERDPTIATVLVAPFPGHPLIRACACCRRPV